MTYINPIQRAATIYKQRANAALAAARAHGPMLRSRVTRELIREQAAESDVSNLLAAILAGLKDCANNPAYAPFAAIATDEIENAMRNISKRHIAHLRGEA